MKRFIVALALLNILVAPVVNAAPVAYKPICGRIVWRTNPATPRGLYHYDVLLRGKILHWTAPTKYPIGGQICA